jgi:type IV pilus assembly protein PilV
MLMISRTSQARARRRATRGQGGFTLIEVLVTILILLFGLLGMAGVQVRATQAEFESYQRKQALLLLEDMVDRIQANRKAASCYAITATTGSPYAGTDSSGASATASLPACGAAGATLQQQAVANADLAAWSDALFGAAEVKAGNNVGVMVGARGCVVDNTGNLYTVSVAWQGISATAAPAAALTCGTGQYGNEALRRVVSATVQIATLN